MEDGVAGGLIGALEIPPQSFAALLREELKAYTGGAVGSVSADTARQIAESMLYALTAAPPGVQECGARLAAGRRALRRQVHHAQTLLRAAQRTAVPVELQCYCDTLFTGLQRFFAQYDLRFAAQADGGDIDYPLLVPLPPELGGIRAFESYLRRLCWENAFCRAFPPGAAERALCALGPGWRLCYENIAGLLLPGALGRILLKGDAFSPWFAPAEAARLERVLGADAAGVASQLAAALDTLTAAFPLPPGAAAYLGRSLPDLAARAVRARGALGAVFTAL